MPNLFVLPGPRNGSNNFTQTYFIPHGAYHVVKAGSTIYASLPNVFWSDHNWIDFANHGTIWNLSSDNAAGAIPGFYVGSVANTGLIVVEATNGNADAISVGAIGTAVDNSGSIYAIANGNATAISHWSSSRA